VCEREKERKEKLFLYPKKGKVFHGKCSEKSDDVNWKFCLRVKLKFSNTFRLKFGVVKRSTFALEPLSVWRGEIVCQVVVYPTRQWIFLSSFLSVCGERALKFCGMVGDFV
jgi:hypothetical protein